MLFITKQIGSLTGLSWVCATIQVAFIDGREQASEKYGISTEHFQSPGVILLTCVT